MEHLKNLRLLNFAIAAYTLVGGLIFLFMFLLPAFIDDPEVPGALFALIGVLAFVLFSGYAAAHVLLGWLIGSGRGRIFQTVFALMQILSFPVGTAYAVYALWVCWGNQSAGRAFDSPLKPGVT